MFLYIKIPYGAKKRKETCDSRFICFNTVQSKAANFKVLTKTEEIDCLHVPLMGGLGNQIFQGVHAISWLSDSPINRRIVVYGGNREWLDFLDLDIQPLMSKIQFCDSFEIPSVARKLVGARLRLTKYKHVIGCQRACWLIDSVLRRLLERKKSINTVIFNQDLGFERIQSFKGQAVVFGYFQTYIFWQKVKVLQNNERIRSYQSKALSPNSLDLSTLVIHIRLGDYLLETDFGNLGWSYYEEAIQVVFESRKFSKVVIFSDEKERAKKLYGCQIQMLLSNILDDFNSHTIQWIGSEDLNNLDCLRLMSTGSMFIIANSSFSWWAANKFPVRNSLVVCPKPWFLHIKEPTEIIPPSWIRISSRFKQEA